MITTMRRIPVSNPFSLGYFYNERTTQDLNWGNTLGAVRWNHLFGPRLFSNMTLTFSRYNFQSSDVYSFQDTLINDSSYKEFRVTQFESLIEDAALKSNFDFLPNPNHYIRFGLSVERHNFRPGHSSTYWRC